MPSAQFETFEGKQIFFIDLRNAQPDEALKVIAEAKAKVAKNPNNSVLSMTDITGGHYNDRVSDALKDLAASNRPFVKASAVVGVTGVRKVIFNAIIVFSKRQMSLFDSQESARRWLAKQ